MIYLIVAGIMILAVIGFFGWKLIEGVKIGAEIGDAVIKASGNGNKQNNVKREKNTKNVR